MQLIHLVFESRFYVILMSSWYLYKKADGTATLTPCIAGVYLPVVLNMQIHDRSIRLIAAQMPCSC